MSSSTCHSVDPVELDPSSSQVLVIRKSPRLESRNTRPWQTEPQLPIMVVLDGVDLDSLDYVVKAPFNGSGAAGGDPLTENVNIWYEVG